MTEKKERPITSDEAVDRAAHGSTYVEFVKAQAYMLQHQQDLLNNCLRRNADLVKVCNQVERENQTLRKKLKGHEDGKLWTLLWAILPTRDMIEPK